METNHEKYSTLRKKKLGKYSTLRVGLGLTRCEAPLRVEGNVAFFLPPKPPCGEGLPG